MTAYRDIEAGCAALLDEMFPGSGGESDKGKTPGGVFLLRGDRRGPQRQKCVGGAVAAVNRDTAVIGGSNKKAPAKGTFR